VLHLFECIKIQIKELRSLFSKLFYMKNFFWMCLLLSFFSSCEKNDKTEQEIAKIHMDISVVRFDKEFAEVTPETFPALKQKYPMFFPKQFADSVWLKRITTDTLQQQLNIEVDKVYPTSQELEEDFTDLFQHISYYFPEFTAPVLYFATSDVEYRNRVILADSLAIVGLDNYLGSEHPFYEQIPLYIGKNLKPSQITQDFASAYARSLISTPKKRNLLSQMIYFGKSLYLKDLWLPSTSDAEKIGYTEAEYTWAQENEVDMWRYFIERELLYSTDPKLPGRFINAAPFSKFYLEIDNESPGMIGRYIGWQMVRSYMKKNPTSLQQLMILAPETIYKESKYKPSK